MNNQETLQYDSLRNVTSQDDSNANRVRRCGVARADQFFDLPDDLNVREYLQKEVDGKPIKKRTEVNEAIRYTLDNEREKFAMLNGGITIICKSASVDDKNRVVHLVEPSIINGSQTRGVLKSYFEENVDDVEYPSVHFELIVCDDEQLAAEITIARNFQNKVIPVSTYGAKGLINELETAMQAHDSNIKLRKSETDGTGNGIIDTEKLVQIITAVVPAEVLMPRAATSGGIRAYAFSQRSLCLKDFSLIMDPSKPEEYAKYAEARQFFKDVAYQAWTIYNSLRTNPAFLVYKEKKVDKHSRRSPVKKDGSYKKVLDVAMGVLFPVVSALGRFIYKAEDEHWKFEIPDDYDLSDLITQSAMIFAQIQDPAKMGKDPNTYIALRPLVEQYLKYRKPVVNG
jgi:hypothetical protein